MPNVDELVPMEGSFKAVRNPETGAIHFEKRVIPEPTGQAFVRTEAMISQTELEMEEGRKAVARAIEQRRTLPPVVKTEKELKSEGGNTPVFRPNTVYADRVNRHQGSPVSQELGTLMRKTGGAVKGEVPAEPAKGEAPTEK